MRGGKASMSIAAKRARRRFSQNLEAVSAVVSEEILMLQIQNEMRAAATQADAVEHGKGSKITHLDDLVLVAAKESKKPLPSLSMAMAALDAKRSDSNPTTPTSGRSPGTPGSKASCAARPLTPGSVRGRSPRRPASGGCNRSTSSESASTGRSLSSERGNLLRSPSRARVRKPGKGDDCEHGIASLLWESQSDPLALIKACKAGDILHALEILRLRTHDVNRSDVSSGATPLMHAVFSGSHHFVQLLVEYGADVNAATREKNTALHYAFNRARQPIVDYLVGEGASLSAKNRLGQVPADLRSMPVTPRLPSDSWKESMLPAHEEDSSAPLDEDITPEQMALETRVACIEQIGDWRHTEPGEEPEEEIPSVEEAASLSLSDLFRLVQSTFAAQKERQVAHAEQQRKALAFRRKVVPTKWESRADRSQLTALASAAEVSACRRKFNDLLLHPNGADDTVELRNRSMEMTTEPAVTYVTKADRIKRVLRKHAGPWSEWADVHDRRFYFNSETNESTWVAPQNYLTSVMASFLLRRDGEERAKHLRIAKERAKHVRHSWYGAALNGDLDHYVDDRVVSIIQRLLWAASGEEGRHVGKRAPRPTSARARAKARSEKKTTLPRRKAKLPRRAMARLEEHILRASSLIGLLAGISKERHNDLVDADDQFRIRNPTKFEQLHGRVYEPDVSGRQFARNPLKARLRELRTGTNGLEGLATVTESVCLAIAGLIQSGTEEHMVLAKMMAFEYITLAITSPLLKEPSRLLGPEFFETGTPPNPLFSTSTNSSMVRLGKLVEQDMDKREGVGKSSVANLKARVSTALVEHGAHRKQIEAYLPPPKSGMPAVVLSDRTKPTARRKTERPSALPTSGRRRISLRPTSAPASTSWERNRTHRAMHERLHGNARRHASQAHAKTTIIPRWVAEYEKAIDSNRKPRGVAGARPMTSQGIRSRASRSASPRRGGRH